MNFLLSMPGGAEWIIVASLGLIFTVFPVVSIILYVRNRELKKKLEAVTKQRDEMLNHMIV